ncbi:hypothetical protein BG011_008910 [Mortierella polycephala]|uniref:polynucleotide adenylyltransferase n=1 Tax=Mortierella polycephala TaxID=41804 RepID=A0A9P6PQ96_9FUNG|nr:hypothetical protein BG011_008910 [Mortierella polycephala]
MVKRDKNAHKSNHYKTTHHSGGKSNKKSGGRGKKGNKSINQFLGIGKPGPHMQKHIKMQEIKKAKKQKKANRNNRNENNDNSNSSVGNSGMNGSSSNSNVGRSSFNDYQGQYKVYDQYNSRHNRANNINGKYSNNNNQSANRSPAPSNAPKTKKQRAMVLRKRQINGGKTRPKQEPGKKTNVNHQPALATASLTGKQKVLALLKERRSKTSKWQQRQELQKRRQRVMKLCPKRKESQYVATETPDRENIAAGGSNRPTAPRIPELPATHTANATSAITAADPTAMPLTTPMSLMAPPSDAASAAAAPIIFKDNQHDEAPREVDSIAAGAIAVPRVIKDNPADELKRGDDFIRFDSVNRPTIASGAQNDAFSLNGPLSSVAAQTTTSVKPEHKHDVGGVTHGHKRKRSLDYGSDTEGYTGPPPGCPWMRHRLYSNMPSVPLMLTQELKDFVNYISPTREEHQVRTYVFKRIAGAIHNMWWDAKVELYGSFDTQLYLPSSDLDIVVMRERNISKRDLHALASHLRRVGISHTIEVIAKAKVPILKLNELISNLAIDISFNTESGLESAATVKLFMEITPALRPLTMLIKHFLTTMSCNEVFHGGIGSYTTTIMVLNFLQMHPKIQTGMIDADDNLGVLLIEFFELYGLCFDYKTVGIRVTDGGSYFLKSQAPAIQGKRDKWLLLTSIDPINPDNNTAKGSRKLSEIRELFVDAYGQLARNVEQRHRTLFGTKGSSAGSGQKEHVRLDNCNRVPADSVEKSSGLHHHPQVSLLKNVLHVPVEAMMERQHIEQVFYKGTFQAMFGDPPGINGLDQVNGRR